METPPQPPCKLLWTVWGWVLRAHALGWQQEHGSIFSNGSARRKIHPTHGGNPSCPATNPYLTSQLHPAPAPSLPQHGSSATSSCANTAPNASRTTSRPTSVSQSPDIPQVFPHHPHSAISPAPNHQAPKASHGLGEIVWGPIGHRGPPQALPSHGTLLPSPQVMPRAQGPQLQATRMLSITLVQLDAPKDVLISGRPPAQDDTRKPGQETSLT